ncbi:lipopolysaccharide assembly protein LapA domain-containing protein [Mycobacterium sp. CVI_P3]|uniref:Lipopolysaccharide assembly protein LapA domain-containing protein n=1 Tax=Mycobacterium pinniadriaticum TaxID=2994102 RepID=A0ABT3SG39_9MYCO|nr:lipopolysaccharide assembly protein LapA domain-containing protein [Mycobacterium pinniadriaticum]MCX2932014.1 lipopolysaccharide assembly protein LapA domain-containing protein [Mycobacterium pinniadriaticum]MCX2938438.1 lipopolysaccharide assembly protein LapA domain-containing protein [Mycobacterium pinniadriaticum]
MTSEPSGPPNEPTPPVPPAPPPPPPDPPVSGAAKPVSEVTFTRAAALWSSVIVGLLILTILLIFIAQNTESTSFAFLGWHWSLPLGVAILLAAVCGGLVAVLAGAARIFQLRRAAKKNLKAARKN